MALKALIFDVDGTLAETEEAHRRSFNQAFVEAGLGWNWGKELYAELLAVSGGKERIGAYLRQMGSEPADHHDLIMELHRQKTAIYADRLRAGEVRLRDGVARLLREARCAGLKLGLATTTSAVNVGRLMEVCLGKRAPRWDAFAAAEDVGCKKPSPEVYLAALAQLTVRACECLAFEDSRNGLLSAKSAGIACLITPSFYTRGEDFDGALAVLDGLGEVAAPCRVLAGPELLRSYVDLAQLRVWHSRQR